MGILWAHTGTIECTGIMYSCCAACLVATFLKGGKHGTAAKREYLEKLTAGMIIPCTQLKLFDTIGQGLSTLLHFYCM